MFTYWIYSYSKISYFQSISFHPSTRYITRQYAFQRDITSNLGNLERDREIKWKQWSKIATMLAVSVARDVISRAWLNLH